MHLCLRLPLLASSSVLIAGFLAAKDPAGYMPMQTVAVHAYDHAHAAAGLLRSGADESSRLFRAAHIEINWEYPFTERPEDVGTDMTSAAFQQIDTRGYIVVRLVTRTPANVFPGALGYALPFAHKGAHVLIFYDRVETLASSLHESACVVLGHAMAHEIGHVLLGSSEHASGGIMQARFTQPTWRLASSGLLHFTRDDVQGMAAGLQRLQNHPILPVQRGALTSLSLSSPRRSPKY